jgi:polyisoprenoid-binding protein YceI
MKFIPLFLVAAALLNFPVCYAQSQEWQLDTSHSSVNFAVDHLVISETTGKFDVYSADVKADRPDFTDAKFNVVIQAKSINTNDPKRDEHLRGADFFNTDKNPTITIEGKKFEKMKDGKYKVFAKVTMNGVTKDEVWDAKFNGITKDPWGGTRAGLKVIATIDRYGYNLKDRKSVV